jgi:phosphoribosylglycinamide formyltransferase-1
LISDTTTRPNASASIDLVISNRPEAAGLYLAAAAGIETRVLDDTIYQDRGWFEELLDDVLGLHGIELVCLAGFMRILSPEMVARWHDRMLNIHPSLLPAFPGLNTHQRALNAGVCFTGCTVHLVRKKVDTGPIITQDVVPVLENDTVGSLAYRVLLAEHRCYALALELMAGGRVVVEGERARILPRAAPTVDTLRL